MNRRDDLTDEDLLHLKQAYHSVEWSLEEICDRFQFAPGALRQFASRRSWKRPTSLYRKGVDRKKIPEPRRETAKLLWDSGETCDRIARWIGVSENTAYALCTREFGFRNLRLNKQTFYFRRNLQIAMLNESGVSIDELASQFWLGSRSIEDILRRVRRVSKTMHKVIDGDVNVSINKYKEHEKVLHASVSTMAELKTVAGHYIIWPTRGRAPVCSARMASMYLVHTDASYSLTDTGTLFERDRTTVAHACAIVEDARDDEQFDSLMDTASMRFKLRIGLET